jgi:hypothetical protein
MGATLHEGVRSVRARLIVRVADTDVYELTDDFGDQLVYNLGPAGSCPAAECAETRRTLFDRVLSEVAAKIGSSISSLHPGAEIRGTVVGYDRNMMVIHIHVPRPHKGEDRTWINCDRIQT